MLKVNLALPLTLKLADEFHNPTEAGFDEAPVWSSSDEAVAMVEVAEDGMSAMVKSVEGKLGTSVIQVSGLVGGKALLGSLSVEMVAGDVAEINVVPGTPVDLTP